MAPCQCRQGCTSRLPVGFAARPCCWWSSQHAVHIPSPPWSLLLSPSPGSGSSVQQPSRWAAWPCPWSSRRGTKDGGGAALRHGTCAGMCLSPAKGLPRGSADPFPRTRSCRNTDAFSARGAGSLSRRPPRIPPGAAAGTEPQAEQRHPPPEHPPGTQGLSVSGWGGAGGPAHRYAVTVPGPVSPTGCRGARWAGGRNPRGDEWGPGARAARSPCPGRAAGGGTHSPPRHIPGTCNVQRKPKKPTSGGGGTGDHLSGLSLVGPSFFFGGWGGGVPLCPAAPSGPRAPAAAPVSALLTVGGGGGVVALSPPPPPAPNRL